MSTMGYLRISPKRRLEILGSVALSLVISACGSHPIKPEGENVKITRESVDADDCKEIGPVEGRVSSAKGTFEQALEDLKLDAARKGANKVKIETTSGTGTAVRGIAYFCE